MFSRRKRRQPEAEPLVPHGLIWQATDEPQNLADSSLKPPDAVRGSSHSRVAEIPVERIHTPQLPARTEAAPSAASNFPASELGAISPPIPWPSPKTTSVIRRPLPMGPAIQPPGVEPTHQPGGPALSTSQDHRHVGAGANPAANAVELQKARASLGTMSAKPADSLLEDRDLEIIELENAARANKSPQTRAIQAAWVSICAGAAARSNKTKRLLGSALAKGRTIFAAVSAKLKNGLVQASSTAFHCANQTHKIFSSGIAIVRSRWAATSPRVARGLNSATAFALRGSAHSREYAEGLARRIRDRHIRVRIQKPVRLQQLIARISGVKSTIRRRFRNDRRLWTSTAMAAVSALLALGVISAVSRYAPGADASRNDLLAQPRKSVITPSGALSQRLRPASAARMVLPPAAARATLSPPNPAPAGAQHPPKTKSAPPRVHRATDEDDYVAPDTYHYYGTGPSR